MHDAGLITYTEGGKSVARRVSVYLWQCWPRHSRPTR